MRRFLAALLALAAFSPTRCAADILLYPLKGTDLTFVLQGEVVVNPGGTLTFQHAMGKLHFRVEDVRWFKVPPIATIANQKVQKSVQSKDVRTCLKAGSWALHHGLLGDFYRAAAAAWQLAPDDPMVQRLAMLKRQMDASLPASDKQEKELRAYVPDGEQMQIIRSKHFLVLHDTAPAPTGRSKKSRAEQRIELLENVYQSFLFKFCLAGVNLDVPKEHLKVVLFAEKDKYLKFASDKPGLSKAAGFYSLESNISVFYDQGTSKMYKALDELNQELQALKTKAVRQRSRNAADVVHLTDTIMLLSLLSRENADIEVVSHEATHHMAAATGLMPNEAKVPVWAAEGLATYFESPEEAAWSGIGAVNKSRLKWYHGLAKDQEHSNIDFIVSDKIFAHVANDGAMLHAYGQAWALTHFLMERYPQKLVDYYRLVGQRRLKTFASPEENLAAFDQVFGANKDSLTSQWRDYMSGLKTDVDTVLEQLDK